MYRRIIDRVPKPAHRAIPDLPHGSILLPIVRAAHAVLDIVVDDEVQFLVREAVVFRQHAVDFVDDGFGYIRVELVITLPVTLSITVQLSCWIAACIFG